VSTSSGREGDRSELGVAIVLGVVGAIVLFDASRITSGLTEIGPVGPRAVPIVVGSGLVALAVALAINVLRGGHGEQEAGEDVDLSHASDWRTLALLAGAFVANILLIDVLGWVISGAILFWGSAFALGSRHYVRDAVIAVVLSLVTFYGFVVGLGINLPAGVLQGIL
jgi:putative tricarboxylic transport membrane protein